MHAHTLVTLVILFQTLFSLSSTQQTDPTNVGTLNACPQIPQVPFPNVRCAMSLVECSDSSCQTGERCCPTTPCGFSKCTFVGTSSDTNVNTPQPIAPPRRPVRPVRRPLGACPPVPATDGPRMCTAVMMPPCDQSKCGNNQRCCFNGCHTVCTAVVPRPGNLRPLVPRPVPRPVPTGECPAVPASEGPRMCTRIFVPPCEQSKCGANEKCCFDGCHTRCTKVGTQVTLPVLPPAPLPLPVPAGECPAIPPTDGPRMCTKILLPPCEQANCGANEKCCFDGCHTRCTNVGAQVTLPVLPPVSTGECPAIPASEGPRMCTRIFLPPCEQSKCGANEKCCFDGCHTRCTKVGNSEIVLPPVLPPKPRAGQCPPAPRGLMCTMVMRPPCVESACGPNQKCCSNGCYSSCTTVTSDLSLAVGIDTDAQQEQQVESEAAATKSTTTESVPTWAIVLLAIGSIIIVITLVVIVQVQLVFSRRQLRY